jgi:hypothetical protein
MASGRRIFGLMTVIAAVRGVGSLAFLVIFGADAIGAEIAVQNAPARRGWSRVKGEGG